ncbi:helix-turn-helix domain-containing protein [Alicyclobacillus sp. ALC3]|uniref:helix-turn-helix domain-containing protein n=1 Tax=Alicyclobacillus sp. ALC3 TaxID=2796143 RepID=UPI002378CE35|nr:helix-turn-helix transcriptional regulator [Alicyclobacillus sp. ALC3]WDL96374.1 helix-turn-helix transcriptional regulator [Alicyclobacillus sp. ALC3]
MPTFGERLRATRREKGINQADFAGVVGISERALQNYETGEREPKISFVQVCAEKLGVSAAFLIGETEDPALVDDRDVSPQEAEFLKWVEDNLEGSFFYDFDKSPEDAKKHMMETLRLVWERERGRKPGQKQGE